MATKRLLSDEDGDQDEMGAKRMKRHPSFATVIKEAMAANSMQNFLAVLEPMLRQVVHEEVQRGLLQGARSVLQRSPHKQIQPNEPSSLRLVFAKRLSLPIFTSTKIEDEESNPLRVFIKDTSGEEENLGPLPSSIKLEIVVINGDFSPKEREDWTAEEFERSIIRERAGKRPLLTGDISVTMKDSVASMEALMITDNSSWVKCRRFRIGARVAPGSCGGLRIREALTESFVVKDHRGELYKKSYPPSLGDEVWRLEKIAKGGVYHRKLSAVGIETVQDFLKQWVVDPHHLRRILGQGMSDRNWEITTNHANTCVLGSKVYHYRKHGSAILLNPICQVVGTMLNGLQISPRVLSGPQKACVEQMVFEAHRQWKTLEEVDEMLGSTVLSQNVMMLQGATEHPSAHQNTVCMPSYPNVGLDMMEGFTANGQADFSGWYSSPASPNPMIRSRDLYTTSDLSSDNDSTISHAFFQGN